MVYLVCFCVSTIFAFLANKTKKRAVFIILSVLSVYTTVALAGLRSFDVGIDTDNYMTYERYWAGAIASESLWAYMRYYLSLGYGEPLFALVVGVVAQVVGNFSVFLLIAHAVIITGVYVGAFRQRKNVEPALVMLLFYLVFFNQSLNILRQHMAMAIVFAFYTDVEQKKWLRFCIGVFIATMIHTSALLSLIYLFVYAALNVRLEILDRKRWYRWALVLGFVLAGVLLLEPVVKLFINIGVLSSKYAFYFKKEKLEPAILVSAFVVLELCAVYYFRKLMAKRSENFEFLAINSVVYLLLMQFSWFLTYGKRLAGYHSLANLVTIALIGSSMKDKTKKRMVSAVIVAVAFVYWLYVYGLRNASHTLPYRFVV